MSAFDAFELSTQVGDAWQLTLYNSLCFDHRRWQLLYSAGSGKHPPRRETYVSAGFERFPIKAVGTGNRTETLAERRRACWAEGVTFVADLKHAGGPTMGIAHFAKRILRLWGILRHPEAYNLPAPSRVVFPATSAAHLKHSWPSAMLKLIAPTTARVAAEELMRSRCCYEHVIVSSRSNTYFVRKEDAEELRTRAHRLAAVAEAPRACADGRLNICYFKRSEGKSGGKWEGGERLIVNLKEVLLEMETATRRVGGTLRVVSANSSHTFEHQVGLFSSCDIMVSVHGSHNANLMWMHGGSAFMELNPHLFYYSSYKELAEVSGVLYLPSRRNSIAHTTNNALAAKAARFKKDFAHLDDAHCQDVSACRNLARNLPTMINMTDFAHNFERGIQHVHASRDGCSTPTRVFSGASWLTSSSRAPRATAESAGPLGGGRA
eukprot:CAMPEP_0183348954 /NCGR_PEP_ID=MMETSP0164_2-20130417/13295_1 /TAXON_ID=221442 /ORGANISM="Coccolithus pelagicus ssp braarudi, Strain PLY182g" /LENGTH=435 /DNA_ID=CAMNT_0025520619 /DNA_START=126 /DNA_END=1433 /DNA_ORIENTATION=-